MTTSSSDLSIAPTSPGARSRRLGILAFALITVMTVIALPLWSLASDVRSEQDITIGPAEVIDDDLYAFTDTFTLEGRANRDVVVAAATITMNGNIAGSLNAIGGDIDISGPVGRSVRVISGNATVSGSVGGDLMVFGGNTEVVESAVIEGDVHIYGGTLELGGAVRGDLSGTVADLNIGGTIDGDVDVESEGLNVTSQAEIVGSLRYVGPSEADIASQAQIRGSVDQQSVAPWGTDGDMRSRFFSPLVRTIWLLVAGAVLIALAPRLASALGSNVGRPWIPAIVGLLAIVLIPLMAILLMVTVIGLPVGLILLTVYLLALYLSQVIVGQRLGTLLLPRRWNDGSRGFLLLAMTIGVIILSALRFVPFPFVSSVVNLLVAIVGLGAATLLLRQLRPEYVSDSRA